MYETKKFDVYGSWLNNSGTMEEKATLDNHYYTINISAHYAGYILHGQPHLKDWFDKSEYYLTYKNNWIDYHGQLQNKLYIIQVCNVDKSTEYLPSQDEASNYYELVASQFLLNS